MRRTVAVVVLIGCAHAPVKPSALDVVQKQIEAYNAHDLLITSGKGEVLVLGKEGLRDRYRKSFAKFPKLQAKVAEQKAEGDNVVLLHEIITGRPDKPDPWDAGWLRYEVRDGVIKSVQMP